MSDLEIRHEGPVLALTLARPAKRNALSLPLIDALHEALDAAELAVNVRVVTLRGAGPDFCAGADLQELLASADRDPAANERDALRLGTLLSRLRACPRPVVAIVQGRALAGGAGLAAACDIVIAAESSRFGYPEMQRGFVPAMVMTLLRRQAGEKKAFELVATGRVIDALEAQALGLVTRVVPDERLQDEAAALVAQLSAADPTAMHLTKKLFYELDGQSFDEGIALGARVNALARTTPEFRAAIARFLTS